MNNSDKPQRSSLSKYITEDTYRCGVVKAAVGSPGGQEEGDVDVGLVLFVSS